MEVATPNSSNRNTGLDVLRFVAVLLVIGRHLHLPEDANSFLQTWKRGGWIGVDMFFVLSGFLVSGLLFKEFQRCGNINIGRFLIRRAFKIYPPFWVFLCFTLIASWGVGYPFPSMLNLCGELLFMQNYFGGIWNHTWSLAVEEHFYFGIAGLCMSLLHRTKTNPFSCVPLIFLVIALLCLALRFLNYFVYSEYSDRIFLFGTHIRIDSLMFGVFLSYCWHFLNLQNNVRKIPSAIFGIVGIFLLAPAFVFPLETTRLIPLIGLSFFYLGSGCLLLAAIRWERPRGVLTKVIASLGATSYSTYLWHMPVATWGYSVISKIELFRSFHAYLICAIVLAFTFGWFMNKLIETPVLRLRELLFPAKTNKHSPESNSDLIAMQK